MKHSGMLTVTSLLSILLSSIHVTDDIVRGFDRFGIQNVFGVLILVVWLSGALVVGDRLSGRIIMLLGGIFAAGMPVLHMSSARAGQVASSSGAFLFIWTLFALSTTGTFSIVLAVRELWRMRASSSPR